LIFKAIRCTALLVARIADLEAAFNALGYEIHVVER
jgi:hypothetical protein